MSCYISELERYIFVTENDRHYHGLSQEKSHRAFSFVDLSLWDKTIHNPYGRQNRPKLSTGMEKQAVHKDLRGRVFPFNQSCLTTGSEPYGFAVNGR